MSKRLKILSDFDGVWTNQGPEAALLLDWMVDKLAEFAGVPLAQAQDELGVLRTAMKEAPEKHGWAPDGRISAYLDEDPLLEAAALARALDLREDDTAKRYAKAVIDAGHETLAVFSEWCFKGATASFSETHPPCIVPEAAAILKAIEDAGAEVVIISNSGADKIASWFQTAGIDAGEGDGHALRVRGSAKKWYLGDTEDAMKVAGRRIALDRPEYRSAILSERPDLMIGDVFSLDLALPHALRGRSILQAPDTIVLRRHDHTPDWVTETRAGGAIDHVVDSVSELPAIVAGLVK
ncbi:MAG: hypothetical protein KUG77_04530 [Nannocystaceae bacterium]|nr:hypothetical protein [Nannocystaceae bacterium]